MSIKKQLHSNNSQSKSKNLELSKRVNFLSKLYASKVREIEILVVENTKLRKEFYTAQGEFINPIEAIQQEIQGEGFGLFSEVKALVTRCKSLEQNIIDLQVVKSQVNLFFI